jgi:hypothetical protein
MSSALLPTLAVRYNADPCQVSNWFINARRRQPQKDARERDDNGSEA